MAKGYLQEALFRAAVSLAPAVKASLREVPFQAAARRVPGVPWVQPVKPRVRQRAPALAAA